MKICNHSKFKQLLPAYVLVTAIFTAVSAATSANEPAPPAPLVAGQPAPVSADTRYGLFGLLDHRSAYGQGAFPEPFLVDDSDHEINEARLDWTHTEAHHDHNDVVK